ncbi:MAG: SAF domain-containing protein [Clostridiales bacterium]|nr:SAF domain-containing protein [Clostridiales bacterium]
MGAKTNKLKTALGILLVLLAIAALFFWEAEGREILLMDTVLVAEADVKAGAAVDAGLFRMVSVPAGTLVDGAVTPKDAAMLYGKEAAMDIVKGSQLSLRYLRDPDTAAEPKPETSFFVIRNEWIYMCSSSLRRGDEALITSADGKLVLGRFAVAYVKDGDGREVTDASSGMYSFTGAGGESERVNTSSPIHHIEIVCELKDYRRILDYCNGSAGATLMLIREMGHG